MTVIVRLAGGLGNQLFQYGTARAIAVRHAVDVKFDVSSFRADPMGRTYKLGAFGIAGGIATAEDLRPYRLTRVRRLYRRIEQRLPVRMRRWIIEPHVQFAPEIARDAGPNVYLEGYWQSEKYFVHIGDTLRNEIRAMPPLSGRHAELARHITSVCAAGVHVRRGDYLTNPTHPVCSADYYRAAFRYVRQRRPGVRFFVFSDDVQWVREELGPEADVTVVADSDGDRTCEDFQLLTLCQHHVIANSSFSWWAAWVAAGEAQIVIAPNRWYSPYHIDTRDIVPERWVRM